MLMLPAAQKPLYDLLRTATANPELFVRTVEMLTNTPSLVGDFRGLMLNLIQSADTAGVSEGRTYLVQSRPLAAKIDAIKALRNVHVGLSLKDSKTVVEGDAPFEAFNLDPVRFNPAQFGYKYVRKPVNP